MTHDWLFHPMIGRWGIVSCRVCGKFDKYLPMGYVTEYPRGDCPGSPVAPSRGEPTAP